MIIPFTSLSNGGAIDISYFRKTGNIQLLRKANISLLKEVLFIKVIGDYTEIEVEYKLKNNSEWQQIQYGFPVDAFESNWTYGIPLWPIFKGKNDIVEYFRAKENGHDIIVYQWVVDSAYSAKSINLNEGLYDEKDTYTILRKWYSTTIYFSKGEIKTLKIFYKIKNTMRDKVPGFCFIPRYTDRNFTYHLTPSSNWGNGMVNEFDLKIDLTDLALVGAEYSVTGIEHLKNDCSIISLNSVNYNLNNSDRINIHYNNHHLKLSKFIKDFKLPHNRVKSIKSSSNNLTVNNLIDNFYQTTWTGKQGDWIEIEFEKIPEKNVESMISLAGLLVLNGDYSCKNKFDNSGKLEKVRIKINDTFFFNTEPWKQDEGNIIINLDRPIYKVVNYKYIDGFATILADGDGLDFNRNIKINKIRIEILSVVGNIEKKVTLSELYFLGR
jgi:hypothetical protein